LEELAALKAVNTVEVRIAQHGSHVLDDKAVRDGRRIPIVGNKVGGNPICGKRPGGDPHQAAATSLLNIPPAPARVPVSTDPHFVSIAERYPHDPLKNTAKR
jgi:hypothetical protein